MGKFNELVEYLQIKLKEVTGAEIVYTPIMKYDEEAIKKNNNANAISIYLKDTPEYIKNTMGGIIYINCVFSIEIRNDKVTNSNDIIDSLNFFRIDSVLYHSTRIANGRVSNSRFLGEDANKNLGYNATLFVTYY